MDVVNTAKHEGARMRLVSPTIGVIMAKSGAASAPTDGATDTGINSTSGSNSDREDAFSSGKKRRREKLKK